MPKDLKGCTFGRWTVLDDTGKGLKILCRCSCGTEKLVNKYNLTHGRTKSCGCLNPRPGTKPKSTVGQKFGRLTIIEELGGGRVRCQCECGNVIVKNKGHITVGNILSCGCLQKETAAKNGEPYRFERTNIAFLRSDKPTKRSSTGVKGVTYRTKKGKYEASFVLQGKTIYCGYHDTLDEAARAIKKMKEKYGAPIIRRWEEKKNDKK